ncbi:MAG: acetylornithine/succinylornithine family transaminase [Pseudomonadota bacterium]|nr:acetylornithine/succinylornithine family transaminase [Pseudomonadota bacterium]
MRQNSKNNELRGVYDNVMLPNYSPANFVPKKAEGSLVWDQDDKEYIDFGGGIAVNSLGHSHPSLIKALTDQSKKIWHLSNYLTNEPAIKLANKLTELTFAENIFFSNSGSEANEAAIKIARKYHSSRNENRHEIVSFQNSFHGRSLLNISLGSSEMHRNGFEPLMPGIKHGVFNDLSCLEELITDQTAAVIIEPVQGEAGVFKATNDFMSKLNEVTSKKGALLIIDEVQSGVGRMGSLYGYMNYDIQPDIVTSAKGLGGGIPIGATLTTKVIGESMQPGTHGSTFGGNPIACAVAHEVLNIVSDEKFLNDVSEKEKLFLNLLSELEAEGVFSDVRSAGLWIGCDLVDKSANEVLDQAYEQGLILVSAGSNCLRLAPALNIPNSEIEKGVEILKQVLLGE